MKIPNFRGIVHKEITPQGTVWVGQYRCNSGKNGTVEGLIASAVLAQVNEKAVAGEAVLLANAA